MVGHFLPQSGRSKSRSKANTSFCNKLGSQIVDSPFLRTALGIAISQKSPAGPILEIRGMGAFFGAHFSKKGI